VTIELFDMFWALYGATCTPLRDSHRHNPMVSTDFPASDVVPATNSDPVSPVRIRSHREGHQRGDADEHDHHA
jgi:hypothetical protein